MTINHVGLPIFPASIPVHVLFDLSDLSDTPNGDGERGQWRGVTPDQYEAMSAYGVETLDELYAALEGERR